MIFDPIAYCISSSYRKHRWVAKNLWYFRTEAAWLYQRRKCRKERNVMLEALNVFREAGERRLQNLLDDIGVECAKFQKELDSLSQKAYECYNNVTNLHHRVREASERKFSKSFELIGYFKFRQKYTAMYKRILLPILTNEMEEAIDNIFEKIEIYSKVAVIKHKYGHKMPHQDRWLLDSITGFTPNGALRDSILDHQIALNGLVFEAVKD